MEKTIAELSAMGKHRTSETYTSTLKSFREFRDGADVELAAIDAPMMERYQAWLAARGLIRNTTSFYMRILRAVYNRAVEADLTPQNRPFRHVYVGVDRTIKRAIPVGVLRHLKNVDLTARPKLCLARDMFMLSLYFRGMSFVDMAYLRKTDVRGSYLTYRRRKTGSVLSIKLTTPMLAILRRYSPEASPFLLPIITDAEGPHRRQYLRAAARINGSLHKISEMIGSPVDITLYCARHSWATLARDKGVDIDVISRGMGHADTRTTQIYLASIDTSRVDRANNLIINSI